MFLGAPTRHTLWDVLLRNENLLRPKERERVKKIDRTVTASGEMSDRRCAVICDTFDRVRARLGR